jgi:hypothetical protein
VERSVAVELAQIRGALMITVMHLLALRGEINDKH